MRFLLLVILGSVSLVCSAAAEEAPPAFTKEPTAARAGANVKIMFAVDRETDVSVFVQDGKGKVVRHLAAGVLGKNAPAPFKAGSRTQSLVWDGKDDGGKALAPERYVVRVGLGLRATFDKAIGWNPRTVGEIKALAVDGKGNLYCLNGYGVPGLSVFDRDGKYLRTLLPHDPARAPGIRTLTREDGVRVPFLTNMRDPYPFAQLGLSGLRSSGSMVVTSDGRVVIAGRRRGQVVVLGADGAIAKPLLGPSVVPAGVKSVGGLAVSPDGAWLYASSPSPTAAKLAVVHRVPWGREPGKPTLFVRDLGTAGALATDAGGNLYACDNARQAVAVFSPEGKNLGAIKVPDAQQVAVHPKTGAVYVVEHVALKKFANRKAATPAWTLPLAKVPGNTPPVFALDSGADRPILWIGCPQQRNYSKYVLWRVEDLGDKPGKPTEFADRGKKGLYSPVHIAVDPVRDQVYVREWRESWRGQWFKRFSGATGKREDLPIRGNEMAIGPKGYLYCRGFHGGQVGSWITRYNHAGKEVPFKKANNPPAAGKPKGLWVLGSLRGATAVGMKGFDVAPNGDIYVLRYFSARGGKGPWAKKGYVFPKFPLGVGYLTPLIDVYGPEGELKRSGVVAYFKQGASGVRVDRAGNIYVADHIKPEGPLLDPRLLVQLPKPGAAGSKLWAWPYGHTNWYLFNTGSLLKFPPSGGTIRPTDATDPGRQFAGTRGRENRHVMLRGALWQHVGMSPVPADTGRGHGGGCVCTNGRFDLDGFGRVFVPDVHRFCVDVLDANGNRITSFGCYGNVDCRGPEITFNWGSFVGCSNKAVYVCDNLNRRIVRVRLDYAATETGAVR